MITLKIFKSGPILESFLIKNSEKFNHLKKFDLIIWWLIKSLKFKIKKLETLLSRCKDLIKTQKEQILEKETEITKLKDDLIKNDSIILTVGSF